MSTPAAKTTAALADEAVTLLTRYIQGGRKSTDLIKAVSVLILEIRSRFTLADGRADWSGRSPGYRKVVGDIYSRSGVTPDIQDTLRAAIRYHLGNDLRGRADAGDLADVGIGAKTPKERVRQYRERVSAIMAASVPDGTDLRGDVARTVINAEVLLDFAADMDLSKTDDLALEATMLALGNMQAVIADLGPRVEAARKALRRRR